MMRRGPAVWKRWTWRLLPNEAGTHMKQGCVRVYICMPPTCHAVSDPRAGSASPSEPWCDDTVAEWVMERDMAKEGSNGESEEGEARSMPEVVAVWTVGGEGKGRSESRPCMCATPSGCDYNAHILSTGGRRVARA